MSEIARKIAAVVELGLSPYLLAAGFRKRAMHFYKRDAKVIEVVDVQSSRWNSGGAGRFRVNAGIHFPEVAGLFPKLVAMPDIPKEYYCILRKMLSPGQRDLWWTVAPDTDINALAEELRAHWQNDVRPWLERNKSMPQAARTFAEASQFLMAAAVHLALGEKAEAERLVNAHIRLLESQMITEIPANARLAANRRQEAREWAAANNLTP